MPIDLYYSRFSGPSRAVWMTARQLKLDFNLKNVDLSVGENTTPEYIALNPNKAVPVVVDDGFVLWESRAIMQYLCNRYAPDSTLYPTDPKQRALVDRALNFDYGIAVHIGYFIGTKLIMNMEPAADKLAGLHASLKILDQLIGANRYLVGNQLTIADLSQLSLNAYLDIIGIDVTPYANYQRWLAGLRVELTYFNEINVIAPNDWHSLLDKYRKNRLPSIYQ